MSSPNRFLKNIWELHRTAEIYVVGGAVRDRLLNRPLYDVDLICPRKAEMLSQAISKKLKGSAFVLDEINHVYRIKIGSDVQIDVADYQAGSFEKDLKRRDYTINALAVPLKDWVSPHWKRSVIDRFKGRRDLQKKQMVAVTSGMLKDDPLRILRGFRIAAELKFKIPLKTLSLLSRHKKWAAQPSPERIREEFLKLFSTDQGYPTLILMEKTGILETLVPEMKQLKKTAHQYYGKGGVLKHSLETVHFLEEIVKNRRSWFPHIHTRIYKALTNKLSGYPELAHLKWGALLHDIGKPDTARIRKGRLRFFDHEHVGAEKIPDLAPRYRWSSHETAKYQKLVRHHMRPGNLASHDITDKAFHRFFRDLGEDAVGMLLVSLADHLTYLSPRQRKKRNSPHEVLTLQMMSLYYQNKKKVLPKRLLDGNDIMTAFHLRPSPLIGALLKDLLEAQSEGTVGSEEQAFRYLKKRIPILERELKSKS